MSVYPCRYPLVTAVLISLVMLFAPGAQAVAGEESILVPSPLEIRLGPRPFALVEGMDDGELKQRLQACREGPFSATDFSIGHRGAPRVYPEHTLESYLAAARQGAGILECDVTFTRDRELVCRHSQCDLHTTTNILEIPELAAKCAQPFVPYDAETGTAASARCCTSDLTLAQFRRLQGKRDNFDPKARTVSEYLGKSSDTGENTRGTLMTHRESIHLFRQLGVGMTPELKKPEVAMPYLGDYTQQDYAGQMVEEYREADIDPQRVWVQSFNLDDVSYWIETHPRFGRQSVWLDSRPFTERGFEPSRQDFDRLRSRGVKIIAPPMFALLDLDDHGRIVASDYARLARAAGFDIIAWTFERSNLRSGAVSADGKATFYYRNIGAAIEKESDMYVALDVLAREVGIIGIFSDWPETVTYYANCMDLN